MDKRIVHKTRVAALACVVFALFLHSYASAQTSSPAMYTGNGGRGMSLAVLVPEGNGLAADQNYLPTMVQGVLVGDMTKYSAITVLDRQSLEKVMAETESGIYTDTADYGKLGEIAQVNHILTGNITKTAAGYAMQLQVVGTGRNSVGVTKASYSGSCSIAELDNFAGVHKASMELLGQLGVQLTDAAKNELFAASPWNSVDAQTSLSRGIEAVKKGTVVEALSYFIQASNFDRGLAEAASRMNILSADIRSGNIGEDARNDIVWRRQWLERLRETESFFANYLKTQQPYYLVYSPDIKQGKIDYEKETVDLVTWVGIVPEFSWREQLNRVIHTVKTGLRATGRAETWGINWPAKSVSAANPFTNKEAVYTVVMEIFNDKGKALGRTSISLGYGYVIRNGIITGSFRDSGEITFPAVPANDITGNLSIRISGIDGLPPEQASKQKQISIMPREEFNRVHGEHLKITAADKGLVMTALIIPYGVTTIGSRAFHENQLTGVIIPDTVTIIEDNAFYENQLTSVIIPDSVTTIEHYAFADNQLTSVIIPDSVRNIDYLAFAGNLITRITIGSNVNLARGSNSFEYDFDFDSFYNRNGKKAGTYIYNGRKRWLFTPRR